MGGSGEGYGGPLAMDPETMRRLGHEVVDRIVDRWSGLAEREVLRTASRSAMEERLGEPLPKAGEPLEPLLERFWEDVEPFAARLDHPRFFAFVPSSPTFASVLGDWLASGCNFIASTWLEGAGPSQLELVVVDWLRECCGLPEGADGLLTSGGSAANLVGLAVA
ncbi:MAG TPA: pyridoxal-dependent decarboxylase, partial [Gemmatimonadota bacterium]|nr:pyridoxal-dependent decarboxylase [Gemmatimonadota bacterium]